MSKMLKRRNIAKGTQTFKYKAGSSGGGLGASPSSQPRGAALTFSANNEVALAGAGDVIIGFLEVAHDEWGTCSVFTSDAGEITDILTNGTLSVGDRLVGYSDSDRGKAVAAGTGGAAARNARWVVKSASAGKANVIA